MPELKQIIANNITSLRKAANLTQSELGDNLNYSDKAVSKWERGESLPDITVLHKMTEMFGVNVDYLLHEEHDKSETERSEIIKARNANRLIITLLSTVLVWLVATIAFVLMELLPVNPGRFLWMSYVYAVPGTLVILLIFNSIWGKRRVNFIIISLLMWTILLCVYLTYVHSDIFIIFLIGIPAQIIIILWGNLRSIKKVRQEVNGKKMVE